jgi:hypothetical protein
MIAQRSNFQSTLKQKSRASTPTVAHAFKWPWQGESSKVEQRGMIKEELFDRIEPLNRGLLASDEEMEEIARLCTRLEGLNPTPSPLSSPLINGGWELLYTTSGSILGATKPPPFRPSGIIIQVLDAVNLKARNIESSPFYNQVSADLEPLGGSRVGVKFQEFKIFGLIPVKAPQRISGSGAWLDITYLDEDTRISRGDKGNLFVLRMKDRGQKP